MIDVNGTGGSGQTEPASNKKPAAVEPVLINLYDAAKVLAVCTRTVQTLVAKQGLPHVRIGKRLLFRPESLDQWVSQKEQRCVDAADAADSSSSTTDC
ncbi:MAG: helix-turn-helix domain-containing protein [Planctomycetes bacterium]|nr:helix-turn-helix domain-containing protein [Planctomycetota bacterium]